MKLLLITILAPVFVLAFPHDNNSPFNNAKYVIEKVNNDPHSTWKAGQNFDSDLPRSYLNVLLGTKELDDAHALPLGEPITDISNDKIPSSFDARNKWKKCKSLHQIRDQGNCGSCWAVSTSSAFTDRLCISTNGKFNGHLAAEEVTSCCSYCGSGCFGGYPESAWSYFRDHGIVTGGDYNSKEGCLPYSVKSCEHHVQGKRPQCSSMGPMVTPACSSKCTNKKYSKPFSSDHKKGATAYSVESDETAIQKEILKNGPVVATFYVYEDFLSYKDGVYKHDPQSPFAGGHAVKVIGWGVEKGSKYWLVQNSWNYDWGNKGLFKILRGTNECGFESRISAGTPAVSINLF